MTDKPETPEEAERRQRDADEAARIQALIEAYNKDAPRRLLLERRRRASGQTARGMDYDVFHPYDD